MTSIPELLSHATVCTELVDPQRGLPVKIPHSYREEGANHQDATHLRVEPKYKGVTGLRRTLSVLDLTFMTPPAQPLEY